MMDERLTQALPYLKGFNTLYDVGTDHAYFPITAVKQNQITHAYAVDNKPEPLLNAKQNIKQHGLTKQITPVLADGLEALKETCDVVMIAGMGGGTIKRIISEASIKNVKRFILQPNNNIHHVRALARDKQWTIKAEIILKQKSLWYFILILDVTPPQTIPSEPYISTYLYEQKNSDYLTYMQQRATHLTNRLKTIPAGKASPQLTHELTVLRRHIDEWHQH